MPSKQPDREDMELEVRVAVLETKQDTTDERLKGIMSAARWIVLGLIGLIGTALWNWIEGGGLHR